VLEALQIKVCALQAEHNKEMVSGLEKAGLKADSGAGVFIKYFLRGGGYYIDVGHSGIIASRQVTFSKVKEMKKSSRTACSSSMARSWQQARWFSRLATSTCAHKRMQALAMKLRTKSAIFAASMRKERSARCGIGPGILAFGSV
jgi:hypothetical protein